MSTETGHNLRIVMLVASMPPMPAGGAEMQALQLAKELTKRGHDVCFITPGNNGFHGKTEVEGMPVYRMHSIFNRFFLWVSKKKKSIQPATIQIEYDDDKEITDVIKTRAGWPTVLYSNIFFLAFLFFSLAKAKAD